MAQPITRFAQVNYMFAEKKKAFSLIELLVVISVIGLLMAILLPALSSARSAAYSVVCRSNLRQLVLANTGYSSENDDFCVPAASDMWLLVGPSRGGLHRWHGVRDRWNEPFDPLRGPLVKYLADGKVKECPERIRFVKNSDISFEWGCGGYGYNMAYLGSCLWQAGIVTMEAWKKAHAETTRISEVTRPTETMMFADTAFCNYDRRLIEYSFAEPPYFVDDGQPAPSWGYASPSIHFRHHKRANVGWADGHISSEKMTPLQEINAYGVKSSDMMLGWFEPIDNSLFDLK